MKRRKTLIQAGFACVLTLVLILSGGLGWLAAPAAVAAQREVVVRPGKLHGWFFVDESTDTRFSPNWFVRGPKNPPLGGGSAYLATNADPASKFSLARKMFGGTPIADIKQLSYSTYVVNGSQTAFTATFQIGIDLDSEDAEHGFQGRLVFDPNLDPTGIAKGTWQTWSWAKMSSAKLWRFSRAPGNTFCSQGAAPGPCTLAEALGHYPRMRIHPDTSSGGGTGWSFLGAMVGDGMPGTTVLIDRVVVEVGRDRFIFNFDPKIGPPKRPADCRNGKWKSINAPEFKSQKSCLNWVRRHK